VNIDRHPILRQWYQTMQKIEECGASEKLTAAVIACGELGQQIDRLLDGDPYTCRCGHPQEDHYAGLNACLWSRTPGGACCVRYRPKGKPDA